MANFVLPKVKVTVKPVIREGNWLERGHSGNWQYDNAYFTVTVPIDKNTGYLKEILTSEEREFFEDSAKSGLDFKPGDLLATKRGDNFWKNYGVKLQKPESIVNEETVLTTLDLSNPFDYIHYAVLRANTSSLGGSVAPSWNERYSSGTYKVALVKDEETLTDVVEKSAKKKEVYKFASSLEKITADMYDFLSIYWLNSKSYKLAPRDSSKEFYIAEIEKIVESDLNGVYEIIKDRDNYPYKLLLHKAIRSGVVSYNMNTGFTTVEGIPLGLTLSDSVAFLKNPKNQETYIRIDNYVKMNE